MFTGFVWLRIENNEFSGWTVNLLRTDLLIKFWRTQNTHMGGEEFCLQLISVMTAYICQVFLATNPGVFSDKSMSLEGRDSPCVRVRFCMRFYILKAMKLLREIRCSYLGRDTGCPDRCRGSTLEYGTNASLQILSTLLFTL
jgi:hypothetical protein